MLDPDLLPCFPLAAELPEMVWLVTLREETRSDPLIVSRFFCNLRECEVGEYAAKCRARKGSQPQRRYDSIQDEHAHPANPFRAELSVVLYLSGNI